jgi:NADH-quinone oxidoreductase subunit L
MLLFVTLIGSPHPYLLHRLYGGDKNYGKFFAYMNLFLGSMLVLVLGDGPVSHVCRLGRRGTLFVSADQFLQ